jgi:S1-C subfamily serine protease
VRENGEIIRPYLGVRYVMLNSEMAERNGLPVSYGAYIIGGDDAAVLPGSPADRAGLADGSVILSIDGVTLRETELATVLRGKEVGQEIELVVWQDGVERTVSVTLEAAPRI